MSWPVPAKSRRPCREDLREQLGALSYPAFAHCLMLLLSRMGYQQFEASGRQSLRGRTRLGGLDLLALAEVGMSRVRLVVLCKQYRRPVSRRFVDELRGVLLRLDARQGLLFTTGTFSPAAQRAASSSTLAPVSLVNGEELAALLVRYGVGVRLTMGGAWQVDRAFFAALQARFPQALQAARTAPRARQPRGLGETVYKKGGDMGWVTHALAGISTLWLVEPLTADLRPDQWPLLLLLAVVGALLPDLDTPRAKLSSLSLLGVQPLRPLSAALQRTLGHRGLLHAPLLLVPLALLGWPLYQSAGFTAAVALWLGYASHLLLDALTPVGLPMWPGRGRIGLPPRSLNGRVLEDLLLPVLAGASLWLVFSHLYTGP